MTKLFTSFAFILGLPVLAFAAARPNVLIVITDDQGYGDLGFHGNPVLKTPNLDAFAKSSVRMTNFYVCPVCSPTRSSLLTGRYNYRTGVVDTFIGRSMMHSDETTLAELLRDAKYRTGLFGKWHLGDCYPMRPQDQGFSEVLMLKGGGLSQPSDPPGGSSYTDPTLFHNGDPKKFKGYVTDVITDGAIDFIDKKSSEPFFAYVAYNCPHGPYQVQAADWKPYQGVDLGPDAFPKIGSPWAGKKLNQDEIGKAYGMIANIDMNFGRLMAKVPENTLVIFLTDNGPGGVRWNGGLRNRKGTVYEGGIRVPCFIRWKGELDGGVPVDMPAAHIDLTPSVLEACGVAIPKMLAIDGQSLLLYCKNLNIDHPARHLFFQWHRGDVPELGRAFAVHGPKYKLVQAAGVGGDTFTAKPELFDIANDPFEEKDLSSEKPEVLKDLRGRYEKWFGDVKSTRNFEGPRIHLGHDREKITTLTRQDWRGPKAGWTPESEGHWDVRFTKAGTYRLTLDFPAAKEKRTATVRIGDKIVSATVEPGITRSVLEAPSVPSKDAKLEVWIEGEKRTGVTYVTVEHNRD